MKYFKIFFLAVSLIWVGMQPSTGWSAQASQKTSHHLSLPWDEVVDYAQKNLPLKRKLCMKSDGYSYIKVDDEYIHTLYPMLGLAEKGYKKPPYFRSAESPGAHISVIYEDEHVVPEEIGKVFNFELKTIVIVHPSKQTHYAVLQVKAPELEKLRTKYGLSKKLHGHEFHISLAKKTTHSH